MGPEPSNTAEFTGELSVGDYGYHQVRASASGPLIDDVLAVRLSGSDTHRDGFVRNVRTGRNAQDNDSSTLRGQLLFTPTPDVSLRLIGDWGRLYQRSVVQQVATIFTTLDDGTPIANNVVQRAARLNYALPAADPFAREVDADAFYRVRMNQWGLTSILDWTVGNAALTSVTAYRAWNWSPRNDADTLGIPVFDSAYTDNHQRQFSQELRLASTGQRTIYYVVGAYYFWQSVRGDGQVRYGSAAPSWYLGSSTPFTNAVLNGFGTTSSSDPETNSFAAFGQGTWHATDRLSVTAGLRFTHERKEGRFVQTTFGPDISSFSATQIAAIQATRAAFASSLDYSASLRDNSLSGTLNLAYKVSDHALAYATYSRGNKSAGLNLIALPTGVDPLVKPETVNLYELGLKSELFDRTLVLNLAAFWTDVGNYQTAVTSTDSSFGFRQYIANANRVRSRGVEVDVKIRPARGTTLSASGSYTDATYRSFANAPCPPEAPNLPTRVCDLSGHRIAGVSKYSASLSVDHERPVSDQLFAYVRTDLSLRSSYLTAISNSRFSRVPGYGLVNLRVGARARDGLWDLSLWARNLLDKNYFQVLTPNDTGLVTAITGDPRTYGATLRTSF